MKKTDPKVSAKIEELTAFNLDILSSTDDENHVVYKIQKDGKTGFDAFQSKVSDVLSYLNNYIENQQSIIEDNAEKVAKYNDDSSRLADAIVKAQKSESDAQASAERIINDAHDQAEKYVEEHRQQIAREREKTLNDAKTECEKMSQTAINEAKNLLSQTNDNAKNIIDGAKIKADRVLQYADAQRKIAKKVHSSVEESLHSLEKDLSNLSDEKLDSIQLDTFSKVNDKATSTNTESAIHHQQVKTTGVPKLNLKPAVEHNSNEANNISAEQKIKNLLLNDDGTINQDVASALTQMSASQSHSK